MAVQESREVVIGATAQEILDVLADVETLPEWSSMHQSTEVLETDDRGRPVRSRQKVGAAGFSDEQTIDYIWDDNGVRWTLVSALTKADARYTLTPQGGATRVKFDMTIDSVVPLPGFILRVAAKGLMRTAIDGLGKRVIAVRDSAT